MLYRRQIRMVINNLIAEAALVVWTQNLFFLVSAHTLVTVSAHTSRCSDSSCVLSMYSGFPPIHQHIPSTFSTVFVALLSRLLPIFFYLCCQFSFRFLAFPGVSIKLNVSFNE